MLSTWVFSSEETRSIIYSKGYLVSDIVMSDLKGSLQITVMFFKRFLSCIYSDL